MLVWRPSKYRSLLHEATATVPRVMNKVDVRQQRTPLIEYTRGNHAVTQVYAQRVLQKGLHEQRVQVLITVNFLTPSKTTSAVAVLESFNKSARCEGFFFTKGQKSPSRIKTSKCFSSLHSVELRYEPGLLHTSRSNTLLISRAYVRARITAQNRRVSFKKQNSRSKIDGKTRHNVNIITSTPLSPIVLTCNTNKAKAQKLMHQTQDFLIKKQNGYCSSPLAWSIDAASNPPGEDEAAPTAPAAVLYEPPSDTSPDHSQSGKKLRALGQSGALNAFVATG